MYPFRTIPADINMMGSGTEPQSLAAGSETFQMPDTAAASNSGQYPVSQVTGAGNTNQEPHQARLPAQYLPDAASSSLGHGLVREAQPQTLSGSGPSHEFAPNLHGMARHIAHHDDGIWSHGGVDPENFAAWEEERTRRALNNFSRTRYAMTGSHEPEVNNNKYMTEGQTKQQHVPDGSFSNVADAAGARGSFAPLLTNTGTASGPQLEESTPRRPIKGHTISASAPPKIAAQAPMVGRREGQFPAELAGSPVRRANLPVIPDFAREVPAIPILSTAQYAALANPSESGRNRATSGSIPASEEVRTARPESINLGQQVTPDNRQSVRDEILRTHRAALAALYQMPFYQIAPLDVSLFKPVVVSRHLSIIAPGGKKPSIDVACDPQNFPFVELLSRAQPRNSSGVVHISNIPYSTTRSEVLAFLGRNAEVLEDRFEPIHIIMDRVSAKTSDVYVEFKDIRQAVRAVNRQQEVHRDGNKGGRLGNRFVSVEVSSLEALMRSLFPRATNVIWRGTIPEIKQTQNDIYSTGFKGFLSSEELVMLVKHVQDPNRIHFAEKCPQRPFETLISTLVRYPWYMPNYITINDRDELFNTALSVVKCLLFRMSEDDLFLNSRLLKRLQRIIFSCPGFTEAQKDDLCFICNENPYTLNPPLAPMADHWYVFKTIGPKPGVQEDVLKYYIALIREATTSMDTVTLAQRGSTYGTGVPNFFGDINIQYAADVKYWTFSQVARIEWDVIDRLLRLSLSRR